jgi:hypothetical protein
VAEEPAGIVDQLHIAPQRKTTIEKDVGKDLTDLHNVIEKLRVNFEIKHFEITSDFERSIDDANSQLATAINSIPDEITGSIESYTTESGDSIHSRLDTMESEVEAIEKTVRTTSLAMDELLKKNGLDSSNTIY